MDIRLQVNDADLQKRLQSLLKAFDKKEKKAILRKAARIVKKQMVRDTPKDTGALSKTIREKTWSRSPDYFVGPMAKPAVYNPDKKKATDPFFAAFLNEGWQHTWVKVGPDRYAAKPKGTKGPGIKTRFISKHKNFILKATEKASPEALAKIEAEVKKKIQP